MIARPGELWPAEAALRWRLITDSVMGGVSQGTLTAEMLLGRKAARMRGGVSLENNGGFIQIALDLDPVGGFRDAGACAGIAIDVMGNGECYGVHLRTAAMARPQQSYRQGFVATACWQTIRLPFREFRPHRIEVPLDPTRLRRIGVVAIGRAFAADLAIARLAFY